MISNPKYGWCTFQIKDFKGSPSYMTSVPIDLLEAFKSYRKNGCGSAYSLLADKESIALENKEESVLHCFEDININQLEAELISDLESDLHNWAVEFTVDDITVSESKEMIQNKINELKALHK